MSGFMLGTEAEQGLREPGTYTQLIWRQTISKGTMSEQDKSEMAIMLANAGDVMDSGGGQWAAEEVKSKSVISRDSCLQVSGRRM